MPVPRLLRLLTATAVLTAAAGSTLVAGSAAVAVGATDVRDASCTAASTGALCAAPDTLLDVRIGDVHPTQPSLGYDEVYYKLGRYSTALSKDAVNKKFDDWCEANGQQEAAAAGPGATLTDSSSFTCTVPVGSETAKTIAPMKTVVIGPGGTLYLTDGHHTLTSFAEDSGLDVHVRLRVVGNLSGLTDAAFWRTMQENRWVWLRDVDGDPITPAQLPGSVGLANFEDDRARSIMYFARDIGYTADGAVPFQEFYWGAWLRAQQGAGIDLAGWDQDDWAASLALVRQISEAQVALPKDTVVDPTSGYTAGDLSALAAWNDGKAASKGEWAKLAMPYSGAKPGKLAYMTEYRKTLPEPTPTDPTPTDPILTDPAPVDPAPADPAPTTPVPAEPAPSNPAPSTPAPTAPGAARGTVTVTGELVAGGTVTVRGTGFAADRSGVRVELHSDPVLLGTIRTDASGAFTLTATLPTALAAGTHTVVVLVDGAEAGATRVVVTAVPRATGTLAATGADGLGAAGALAVTTLLAGTGLFVGRRRTAAGRRSVVGAPHSR